MFFLILFKFTHGDKSPTPFSCSARANGETVASSVILGAWENHPKKRYTNYPINYFHSHTSIGMSLIPFSNSKSFKWNICSDKKGVGLEQNIKRRCQQQIRKRRGWVLSESGTALQFLHDFKAWYRCTGTFIIHK